MKRYQELVDDNRIKFVTFHQSYGYEEFVEGIRPVTPDDPDFEGEGAQSSIQYDVRDGSFKKLCALATGSTEVAKVRYELDPSKNRVWKMSLGNSRRPEEDYIYDRCIDEGCILLGWGEGLDFSRCSTRDEVFGKLREKQPDISTFDYHVTSTNMFKNEMKIGDLVIVSQGNTKFRAIAKVIGGYEHDAPVEFGQLRRVEWLYLPEESQPYEMISKKRFSQMTLYEFGNIDKSLKVSAINDLLSGTVPQRPDNHVLIIDEINRGNISKIMGELITLLEKDKRLGEQNALKVTLPYSGKAFGVPSNLFLVGTMNTADRSIALMDTALRRRFHFKELMPDPSLLREKIIDGVDTAKMLIAMNDRIELLFDRDHQIGHSFFIQDDDLEDLKHTFLDSVIPLLQEYFYGDWEKICIVLGCAHEMEGSAATRNAFPIIKAEELSTDGIPLYVKDDYDDRLRYDVNQAFVSATKDLAQYFQGIYDAGAVRRDADTGEA